MSVLNSPVALFFPLHYYSDCELQTKLTSFSLSTCTWQPSSRWNMNSSVVGWKVHKVLFRLDESHVRVLWTICVGNNGACTVKHNEHHCMCLYFQLRVRGFCFFCELQVQAAVRVSECSVFSLFCVWLLRFFVNVIHSLTVWNKDSWFCSTHGFILHY